MPKKNVEDVLGSLDDQIIDLVGNFVKRRKKAYEKAAIELKNGMRDDMVRYTLMLDARKISKEDFEFLVRGRSAQIRIELLEQVSISKSKFDIIAEDVIHLMIRSAITVVATV